MLCVSDTKDTEQSDEISSTNMNKSSEDVELCCSAILIEQNGLYHDKTDFDAIQSSFSTSSNNTNLEDIIDCPQYNLCILYVIATSNATYANHGYNCM